MRCASFYTCKKEKEKKTQIESQYQERLGGLAAQNVFSSAFWPVNVTRTVI